MSKKPKYNWNEPSLFPNDDTHPASMEYRGIKTVVNKYGEQVNVAVITKTKDYFVEQARKIWGDRYDYSESEYTHGKAPIVIYCPKHDYHFKVGMAQNHIMKERKGFKPTGCPVCRAEETHGHEYGTDWRKYLKICAKNNRVGRIYQHKSRPVKTPEQRAAEETARQSKQRKEQAYIEHWKAKNLKEAHFLEKLQSRYPDMYDTQLVEFKDKDNNITLICPTHGEFQITARQLFGDNRHKPHGCWQCAGLTSPLKRKKKEKVTAEAVVDKIRSLYPKNGHHLRGFICTNMVDLKHNKATYRCYRHGNITHSIKYWMSGKGCEYCDGTKFWPKDFLKLARAKHGNKYKYRGVKQIKSKVSIIKIHCDNPNHHWWPQRVERHLAGDGCRECAGRHQPVLQRCQEWIDKCIEKYGEGRYDYSRAYEDYVNNDSLVWIRCCIHNHWFKTTPDNNLRTVNGSCPICSADLVESQGEQTIRRWLEEHNINFEKEPEIPNENPRCKRAFLKPDFWLPEYNIYIEYNGEQHYEDVEHFHGDDWNLEDQQERDRTMRWYCERHGHQLLEIPYWDYDHIGEILEERLLKYNVNELTKPTTKPSKNG